MSNFMAFWWLSPPSHSPFPRKRFSKLSQNWTEARKSTTNVSNIDLPTPPTSPPRQVLKTANWRSNAVPLPPKPVANYTFAEPGHVLYIPGRQYIPLQSCIYGQLHGSNQWGIFGHPIISLGTFVGDNNVEYLSFITCSAMSKNGGGIPACWNLEKRSILRLIKHEGAIPHDGTSQLNLRPDSNTFKKQTYARLDKIFHIELAHVQAWENAIALCNDSVLRLKQLDKL
ncbi:hypothetical protein K505DRAFT_354989 [Melanomma pulvis-pyrius CBS 109.77]|uniref:Uncharacterized protein n=1 Tax=Melanomma pulvis-pyrius CBS 109.77 TaxID=1314802 RepID=A0A6A6XX76_9PLEO|nr:hypothetical protein K505DRAFT_354989 [Melanomma pulvis-pyrius CBS 109.77]